MSTATTGAAASLRARRMNAALTLVLLCVIAAFTTVLVERHLDARVDLSEDGLYTISDATRNLVDRIEDPLTVRLFVTEEITDGSHALRSARVRSQLDELIALDEDAFELVILDPSRSSEARQRASESGFSAMSARSGALGGGGESVWLSIELGYRGRIERIARPRPSEFELQFASSLHSILNDRRIGIGWYGARITPQVGASEEDRQQMVGFSSFGRVAAAFDARGDFRELVGLESGRPIPESIDVLFVVRPGNVHERAVYAIDQFVQRGGKLVVCLDDPDFSVFSGQALITGEDEMTSRMSSLLRKWGIAISPGHVWDEEWRGSRLRYQVIEGKPVPTQLQSPLVIRVPDEGLNQDLPPTRGLGEVWFSWAHPLDSIERIAPPPGVTRTDLAWTSERSWLREIGTSLPNSQRSIRNLLSALRNAPASKFTLAAALDGKFPSPWAGRTPPTPVDTLGLGTPPVEGEVARSAQVTSQVVVFGDADWLRDPVREMQTQPFLFGGGGNLAINLVDWLVLDEELIELRSRAPKPRPLRDFAREEAKALGVFEADPYETSIERAERNKLLDEARATARRKQWLIMALPALAALAIVALFGGLWNALQRRRADQ